ncbi:MAG: haloacid dehalogenase [Candidatus Peregrinibacteria bacterium Gr01-1014_25]|nr:MAG: haloacid dehalogenase [Candidatus Peregrinibacteria bacterium Gr01-1014_25]
MQYNIPGQEPLTIETLILDLNGTLAIDGKLIDGVRERIKELREQAMRIVLFTGDTNGNAAGIADELQLEVHVTKDALAKADEAKKLRPETAAAIGNGRIDLELFQTVRLRILTLQAEGVHRDTLLASDIIVPSINDALDLFLKPKRLIATMRK